MEISDRQPLVGLRAFLDQSEERSLSDRATRSLAGIRRRSEPRVDSGYRQNFSLDVDRILHSLAYTRYIDKTQVFYLIRNDHITHRVLHVQLVSKIARTIGRFLRLNEDLIEAIALGHDIGHAPFGHDGERFLSSLCQRHAIGHFHHNLQSVQFLERVERKGRGWNLCLQTLDGILAHDGEVHNQTLEPQTIKRFEDLDREVETKRHHPEVEVVPMTMEGCVVRMADTISYIGRDIEDAIRLNLVQRGELPREVVQVLGDTNGTIVYRLVTDIIQQSAGKPFVAFGPEVSEALKRLKDFNLERIYMNPTIKRHLNQIGHLFQELFDRYLRDLQKKNIKSLIFDSFLKDMDERYVAEHRHPEIVRDFIAGMTDRYFLEHFPAERRPAIETR
jgi:dGTPase